MSNITAEVPREKLKELVEKNGESLLQDPDRCEGLLKDHCGAHRREISALVGALEERIPLELKSSWQTAMTPEAMRARLVQRLEENRGLAPDVANWAVDAWSYALGVGLARRSDRVEDAAGGAAAGLAGAGLAGGVWAAGNSSASIAERVASDRAGGAVAVTGAAAKSASIAPLNTPKKAGIGAVALLALTAAAVAIMHHPTPQPGPGPAPGPNPPTPIVNPKPKPAVIDDPAGHGKGINANGDNHAASATFMPVGTAISIRLTQAINSDDVNVGDLLDATVGSPVTVDGNVVVATGAKARLKVTAVDRTAKAGGMEHLQLALVDVSTEQGRVQVSSNAKQFDGPPAHVEAAKRAGIGAAAGAVGGFVVGKIFHHGGTGAAAGAGGGAVVGAVTTKPNPVKVPAETAIHFHLARAVQASSTNTAKK
jgi:hypothetical protein